MKRFIIESLVIVISITLAFLAEDLRQYLNERSNEKEILIGIKEDILSDSSQFHDLARLVKEKLPRIDSALKAIDGHKNYFVPGDTIDIDCLLGKYVPFPRTASYNDLKSSYGTKLIRSKSLRKAITKYYELRDYNVLFLLRDIANNEMYIERELVDNYIWVDYRLVAVDKSLSKYELRNICMLKRDNLEAQLNTFNLQLRRSKEVLKLMEE